VKCDSYTWIDGNTYTASNNTATYILTNSLGCDSILNLNLVINESSTGTDAQFANESYTWIDGVTYTESNSSATYTLTNSNNCDSVVTLDLTINSSSDLDVFDNKNEIRVFPNPTKNYCNISIEGVDFAEFILLDIQGKVLFQQSIFSKNNHINLSRFVTGTYFLKIKTPEQIRVIRVTKL
jgi:hypothetical protein